MGVDVIGLVKCFHCGQRCEEVLWSNDKPFCCVGCKTVYQILNENNLCEYYTVDRNAGSSQKGLPSRSFAFLEEPEVRKKVLSFDSRHLAKVSFFLPAVHCVSCIWLLENLRKINAGILRAEIAFGKKTIAIDFDPTIIRLSEVADLLSSLGYAPEINLQSGEKEKVKIDRSLVFKLAVAGFCFGNVMLFSFPEYLGIDNQEEYLVSAFSYLNLILSLPVFFYSAWGYFTSSIQSFQQRQINIDVPIAAGLLALFLRSSFDILTSSGPGYLDSFTGLVFFLLIGRWFQSKTYENLAFDRDYKSYFPLAVSRLQDGDWRSVIIYELKKGDLIRIRNMEIVPADAVLMDGHAYIDYSFVTGESRPGKVQRGEMVYAGGRVVGQPVELVVDRRTSQSHLTSLWNKDSFKKITESHYQKIIDRAARKFTWIVIALACVTATYWYFYQPSQMWLVLTSVLMVACPCALALAAPFTYGSMLRAFGRNNFYLKNADVIERLASIDSVVFDKTGTVTYGSVPDVTFSGSLSEEDKWAIKLLTDASMHPLSVEITRSIDAPTSGKISYFEEIPGKGVQGIINGKFIKAGSADFVGAKNHFKSDGSTVFVAVDNEVKGCFAVRVRTRGNIKDMLDRLGEKCVALLSGDNEADRHRMSKLFNPSVQLLFNQDPHDKLDYISKLQKSGRKVLMVGDGLNDSGALKQSDVGIAVSDRSGFFSPACDGILAGENLSRLDKFLDLARSSSIILKTAFGISFCYNAIALTFAVTGNLTPLVAAILMPVSSISVVGFATVAVNYITNKKLR